MDLTPEKRDSLPDIGFARKIPNRQADVPVLMADIEGWLKDVGVAEEKVMDIQIVLGEALNNVIEHGFEHENDGTIETVIDVDQKKIRCQLIDNGTTFTPPIVKESPVEVDGALNDMPEGGFGWFLINEITTSFSFERSSNKNRLKLNF